MTLVRFVPEGHPAASATSLWSTALAGVCATLGGFAFGALLGGVAAWAQPAPAPAPREISAAASAAPTAAPTASAASAASTLRPRPVPQPPPRTPAPLADPLTQPGLGQPATPQIRIPLGKKPPPPASAPR